MSVDRELCQAYRDGFDNKIVASNARIDAEHARIDKVDTKVDSLKSNEFEHLKDNLEKYRKERREPLGWKQKVMLISSLMGSATAITISIIQHLKP